MGCQRSSWSPLETHRYEGPTHAEVSNSRESRRTFRSDPHGWEGWSGCRPLPRVEPRSDHPGRGGGAGAWWTASGRRTGLWSDGRTVDPPAQSRCLPGRRSRRSSPVTRFRPTGPGNPSLSPYSFPSGPRWGESEHRHPVAPGPRRLGFEHRHPVAPCSGKRGFEYGHPLATRWRGHGSRGGYPVAPGASCDRW